MTCLFVTPRRDLPADPALLPPALRAGCETKRHPAALCDSVGVRLLLRRALERLWPGTCALLSVEASGKPVLAVSAPAGEADGEPNGVGRGQTPPAATGDRLPEVKDTDLPASMPAYVSFSHSADFWAVALSDAPCGVDVEDARRVRDPVGSARRFLPPAEAEAVARTPAGEQALRFLQSFCPREAALKRGDAARLADLLAAPVPPAFFQPLETAAHTVSLLAAVGDGPFSVCRIPPDEL